MLLVLVLAFREMPTQQSCFEFFRDEYADSEIIKAQESEEGVKHAPLWLPQILRYENSPREASGLTIDAIARGPILMSSLFLGPALLDLALKAAGCDSTNGEECDNRIYGFRPT